MSVYLCVCTAALKLPCVIQKRGRTGEKKKKKIEDLDVQADGARVRYGIMGCQVSKGRMYLPIQNKMDFWPKSNIPYILI